MCLLDNWKLFQWSDLCTDYQAQCDVLSWRDLDPATIQISRHRSGRMQLSDVLRDCIFRLSLVTVLVIVHQITVDVWFLEGLLVREDGSYADLDTVWVVPNIPCIHAVCHDADCFYVPRMRIVTLRRLTSEHVRTFRRRCNLLRLWRDSTLLRELQNTTRSLTRRSLVVDWHIRSRGSVYDKRVTTGKSNHKALTLLLTRCHIEKSIRHRRLLLLLALRALVEDFWGNTHTMHYLLCWVTLATGVPQIFLM